MQRCRFRGKILQRAAPRISARHVLSAKPQACQAWSQQRPFSTDTIFALLTPPAVFGGLLVSLWTYKCIMMVLFQNKIIYMPSVPPFSRSEKVDDYAVQCRPVVWTEHAINSLDGTDIKLLQGSIGHSTPVSSHKHVVVLYFQGNASSLPPRLPYLSRILKSIAQQSNAERLPVHYTLVALSYRGFWTSSGRPSQPGIELDAAAALHWIFHNFQGANTKVVLWGQSIGAGAASVTLARSLSMDQGRTRTDRVAGLLLETPFVNLRAMLVALYPQKFLPYRYLAPFLRSTWDSEVALRTVGIAKTELKVLILQAGDDELVPADNASSLVRVCKETGMSVEHILITGALHTEVMAKPQGRKAIAQFIESFGYQDDIP